ncbi:MAG: GIY-YIG nuclease family protein [Ignavibacteriaceae bacterium]
MRGKSVKIFILTEDNYKDFKSVELSNWIGKAYIGERKHLRILSEFDELKSPAIYYLISTNIETNQKKLYIGEADDASVRIKQHSSKDWWDLFVVFISKDANLTKSHVRYLEKVSYNLVLDNPTTIDLINNVIPTGSKLPPSDISDMEIFHENIVFILNNLGIIDFTKVSSTEITKTEDEIFYLNLTTNRKDNEGNQLQGKMVLTENGFRLLKDSYIEIEERESFKRHNYYALRKKLEKESYFAKSEFEGCLILLKDVDFKSASAAAAIVKNRATNGKTEWKTENGISLAKYLSEN